MPEETCAQCGHPLPADGRFCTRCGAVFVRPPAPPPAPGPESVRRADAGVTLIEVRAPEPAQRSSQATMFGFAPPTEKRAVASDGPPPAAVEAPAPAPPQGSTSKKTMLGVAPVMRVAPAATPAPPPASTAAPASVAVPNAKGTMIGVAVPGIAPIHLSDPPVPPRKGPSSTMLGVAAPGIAPIHTSAAPAPVRSQRPKPAILPKPAPLVDDEPQLGPAPALARHGVPVAYVAGGVLALVLVVGVAVMLLWKGQSLIVVPKLDAQGHEALHLACDSCQDGTTATLGPSHADFHDKEAELALATPLAVGDNPLSIHLDRPGWGRDEEVRVVVPIAFRIKADLGGLSGAHPAVIVRVEAVPGSVVTVEGHPVSLDAKGVGSYSVDVASLTTGFSDDLRLIDQSLRYAITPATVGGGVPAGATPQTGTLAVRAGIATLHLDTPGLSAVIDTPSFRVHGHTVKGGTVTANGQPVPVDADGVFGRSFDAPSLGDTAVELRADGPQLASRTAKLTVKRVARLSDEARARERAPWLGYDAIMADPSGSTGKDTIVEGEVVETRTTAGQTLALIEDARGCAAGRGACLARVVYGGDDPLAKGAHVRVFGKVTGVLATATPAIPVVQADFVVAGRTGSRGP